MQASSFRRSNFHSALAVLVFVGAAAALAQDVPPKTATNDLLTEFIDSVVALREAPGVHGVDDVLTRLRNREHGPPPESMDERIAYARETHWAFRPVRRPEVPETESTARNIDTLMSARLDDRGLKIGPEATKRELIRRVSYDLIGLPPTPEEVDAFLADDLDDGFERVVDRLLASPRFGERWARYWLDVARYSDTKGYVFEQDRNFAFSHTYRDYVIRAFNDDLPYDQFLMHQIAADQMDLGEDKRPLAAMGFLTLGRRFIENVHDIIDDRIDVVTRGTMGLTVTCARCHEHKYDPVPSEDYYSLYGVFRSAHEPGELPLIEEPDPNDETYQDYLKKVGEKEKTLSDFLDSRFVELSQHCREKVGEYMLAAYDGRDIAEQGELQELAKDRELHWQLLERWRDFLKAGERESHPIFGVWQDFSALAAENFEAGAAVFVAALADPKTERVRNPLLVDALEASPKSMEEVAQRFGELFAKADGAWVQLFAARTQMAMQAGDESIELPDGLPDPNLEAFRQAIYSSESPANVARGEFEQFLDIPTKAKITQMRKATQREKATHPGRPDRAMVLQDNETPFDPYVFERGKPGAKGEAVPRQFLAVLAGDAREPFSQGSGRLELARAIAHEDNPLTARVYVNRVWMKLMGSPFVSTPSDFGLRSDPPTHPGVLDYLAWEFVAENWSVKSLIRSITLSETYRQSSEVRRKGLRKDPENVLLWRQNRKRLDFEAMRDSFLVAAKSLDLSMGGPSVQITKPPYTTRRSIYSHIERQNLPAVFRTFDFAGPDTHSPKRFTTTVPQQALFMMNSPFVVEQAKAVIGREEVRACEDPKDRVRTLYRILLQRDPDPFETKSALRFVESQGLGEGPEPPPPSVWHYGYGHLNAESERLESFTALPLYQDGAWRGGKEMPDETLAWVSLNRDGGHTGRDAEHAAIRRWVAPFAASVTVNSTLRHASENGDGVVGYIVHNLQEILWTETVLNGKEEAEIESVEVAKGDTLDFVAACNANDSYDSFRWTPHISVLDQLGDDAHEGGRDLEWHARSGFEGPPKKLPEPLTAWEEYAQVLLLTNEFMFVD